MDWIGNNLYWTNDGYRKTISVARLAQASQTRKTLLEGDMSHPRAIVVDPLNRLDTTHNAPLHPDIKHCAFGTTKKTASLLCVCVCVCLCVCARSCIYACGQTYMGICIILSVVAYSVEKGFKCEI